VHTPYVKIALLQPLPFVNTKNSKGPLESLAKVVSLVVVFVVILKSMRKWQSMFSLPNNILPILPPCAVGLKAYITGPNNKAQSSW
jgi:hypothetical protein